MLTYRQNGEKVSDTMKLFTSRDSASPADYSQARRDHPEYAALCDCEDRLKSARDALMDACALTVCKKARIAVNSAIAAVIERRQEMEKDIYPGVECADVMDMSALFEGEPQ